MNAQTTTHRYCALALLALLVPAFAGAQELEGTVAVDGTLSNMEELMSDVYRSIIYRAGPFIRIACGIGAVGAIISVTSHVASKLISGAPIQLTALFKPLGILAVLLLYFELLAGLNAMLSPTVYATKAMVANESQAVERVLAELEDTRKQTDEFAMFAGADGQGDFEEYLTKAGYTPSGGWGVDDTFTEMGLLVAFKAEAAMYNLRSQFRYLIFTMMSWIFSAVVFLINTLRSFTLAVLGLLGPLALGFSLIPGFGGSFGSWAGRYVTVYLWLPVANVFAYIISRIQVHFAELTIVDLDNGVTSLGAADGLYFIMLLTGAVGYLMVPTVTGYFIQASGAANLMSGAMSAMRMGAGAAVGGAVGAAAATAGTAMKAPGFLAGAMGKSQYSRLGGYTGGQLAGAGARAGVNGAKAVGRGAKAAGGAIKNGYNRMRNAVSPPKR